MNIIWGSVEEPELNAYLSQWAAIQLFRTLDGFGPCTTMGVFDGPKLVAVMVYHNMDRKAGVLEISGTCLDPRWLTRKVLQEMFAYPFNELGVQMLVMRVSANDTRLLRMLTAFGFDHYTIARLRGRNEDERVFTLTDDAWRANKFTRRNSNGRILHEAA